MTLKELCILGVTRFLFCFTQESIWESVMSQVSVNGNNGDVHVIINSGCYGNMWRVCTGWEHVLRSMERQFLSCFFGQPSSLNQTFHLVPSHYHLRAVLPNHLLFLFAPVTNLFYLLSLPSFLFFVPSLPLWQILLMCCYVCLLAQCTHTYTHLCGVSTLLS